MSCEQFIVRLLILTVGYGFFLISTAAPATAHAVEKNREYGPTENELSLRQIISLTPSGQTALTWRFGTGKREKTTWTHPNRRLSCCPGTIHSRSFATVGPN